MRAGSPRRNGLRGRRRWPRRAWTQSCRDAKAPCQLSEIRLVRSRHRGLPARGSRIFRADKFTPRYASSSHRWAPISEGRRPRHCKNAFILDREFELQVLPPIVWVAVGEERNRIRRKAKIFFCGSFQTFFRLFVVEQPITFHHLQSLRVRRAGPPFLPPLRSRPADNVPPRAEPACTACRTHRPWQTDGQS